MITALLKEKIVMADENQQKVVQIHDRAFRSAMSDLRVAKDFLEHYLPFAIKNKVDFSTLKLRKESYVDEELTLLITDVLYSVKFKDKQDKTPVFIYLLCEHLSAPQKLAPWRTIKYSGRIIDQHLKETGGNKLPLVIPLVVYNGKVKYPHSTSVYDLFNEEEKALAQAYMFNRFQLIDFTQIADEEIRTHRWSYLMEGLLKHAFSRDIMSYLEGLAREFNELARQHADEYILGMLKYVIESTEIEDKQRFINFLHNSLPKPLEQQAMTLAQVWKNEGVQLGMQKTIVVLDLLKKGESIEKIAEITDLSIEQILEIKKHLHH